MSAILKDDVLRGKSREVSSKEKVDKIMNTIIESIEVPHPAMTEVNEGKSPAESIKSTETESILKQQIFSSEIVLEGENKSDLSEMKNKLIKELKPLNEIESILVDRVVSSIWRLKRCLRIERHLMEYETSCIQEYEQGFFRTRKRTDKEREQLKALKILENKNRIAELTKYETMLEMQLYKALRALDQYRLREMKREKRVWRRDR